VVAVPPIPTSPRRSAAALRERDSAA